MGLVRFRDPTGDVHSGTMSGDAIESGDSTYSVAAVDLLPPVLPSKVVGIGHNFPAEGREHREYPEFPRTFLKPNTTVTAHGKTVTVPTANPVHFEAELGVVIGETCRHVSKDRVGDVVRGFTCINDLTMETDAELDPFGVLSKGFDGATPIGPRMITPSDLPSDAAIESFLNGELMQSASFESAVYTVGEAVEKLTEHMTLKRNDVVSMGTPAGTAHVAPGDEVEIRIEGVGSLVNTFADPE